MKKPHNPKSGHAQTRSAFVFKPYELNIENLYFTAVFNDSGFDSARIFANSVMPAELILKYNYRFDSEEFPNMADEDIYTEIKAITDPYLSDPINLRVWEVSEQSIDISETSTSGTYWMRSPTRDPQLLCDLDHHSKTSSSNSKSSGSSNTQITWDEDRTTGIMSTYLNICIIPPPRRQETYTLSASHFYLDENSAAQEQTVNTVTLKADIYNVTKEDLEFKHVHGVNYANEKRGQSVLFALSYKGDKYGPAKLNNVSRYSGYLLDQNNTNMCLLHSQSRGLSAIFYYPSTHDRNTLNAGSSGSTYTNAITLNEDFDISQISPRCQGNHWDWIKSYTSFQVKLAHSLGIPFVVSYHDQGQNDSGDDESPLNALHLGFMDNAEYIKLEDNCGNSIELRFYGSDDIDFNGEYIYHKTKYFTSEGTQYTNSTTEFYKWSEDFEDGSGLLKIRRAGPAY